MDSADRAVVLEAFALSVSIPLGFRIVGVPRTQALLRSWASRPNGKAGSDPLALIHRVRRIQRVVQRSMSAEGNCLPRSLTLWAMLLRRGIATSLRIGFRKRAGRIQGHAWVEYDGEPINEDRAEANTFVAYDEPVTFDLWRRMRTGHLLSENTPR